MAVCFKAVPPQQRAPNLTTQHIRDAVGLFLRQYQDILKDKTAKCRFSVLKFSMGKVHIFELYFLNKSVSTQGIFMSYGQFGHAESEYAVSFGQKTSSGPPKMILCLEKYFFFIFTGMVNWATLSPKIALELKNSHYFKKYLEKTEIFQFFCMGAPSPPPNFEKPVISGERA